MLEWTLLWAVLKYRQRKCVKNCTICIKFLNMASGMRLFWNFRNCFNPINFLFKLYIYVVSLCTHYYPLNGLVECCDEIYVANQLPGARKYFCIDQTLEICYIYLQLSPQHSKFQNWSLYYRVWKNENMLIRSLFIASTVKISSDGKSFHPINYIYPCILPLL